MNYLAHAYLSPDDPRILMGNLWGDLLRPKDYEDLGEPVLEGIAIHKRIDKFTDQHVDVVRLKELLRPFQGKYTPVVTDVLMDHMLSKFWDQYHEESIEDFCRKKYITVVGYLDLIPERLHARINRMLDNEWLESCKNRSRMERTLQMLSHRAAFENNIRNALIPYDLHQTEMDERFLTFFDDLNKAVNLRNEG